RLDDDDGEERNQKDGVEAHRTLALGLGRSPGLVVARLALRVGCGGLAGLAGLAGLGGLGGGAHGLLLALVPVVVALVPALGALGALGGRGLTRLLLPAATTALLLLRTLCPGSGLARGRRFSSGSAARAGARTVDHRLGGLTRFLVTRGFARAGQKRELAA